MAEPRKAKTKPNIIGQIIMASVISTLVIFGLAIP